MGDFLETIFKAHKNHKYASVKKNIKMIYKVGLTMPLEDDKQQCFTFIALKIHAYVYVQIYVLISCLGIWQLSFSDLMHQVHTIVIVSAAL